MMARNDKIAEEIQSLLESHEKSAEQVEKQHEHWEKERKVRYD